MNKSTYKYSKQAELTTTASLSLFDLAIRTANA